MDKLGDGVLVGDKTSKTLLALSDVGYLVFSRPVKCDIKVNTDGCRSLLCSCLLRNKLSLPNVEFVIPRNNMKSLFTYTSSFTGAILFFLHAATCLLEGNFTPSRFPVKLRMLS